MTPAQGSSSKEYDVFISHAGEDKDAVVRPLATELDVLGLDVWFDEFELEMGDSLRESIDEGLSMSRFGIIVLSEQFMGKDWPESELNALMNLYHSDNVGIIPLWYDITKDHVVKYSPILSDLIAKPIDRDSIHDRAGDIVNLVRKERTDVEEEWGDGTDGDGDPIEFTTVEITIQEYVDLERGQKVTLESWRNHSPPDLTSLEAVDLYNHEKDIVHEGSRAMTTKQTITDEPIEGMVAEITDLSSNKTEFKMRVDQARLDELPDDRDFYTSFV